jgi:hypothetical protein
MMTLVMVTFAVVMVVALMKVTLMGKVKLMRGRIYLLSLSWCGWLRHDRDLCSHASGFPRAELVDRDKSGLVVAGKH